MSAGRNGSTHKKHGVAITGIGAITPIGHGAEGLWDGIRKGCSAVRTITRFDASTLPSQMAAEVDFDPLSVLDARESRRFDRYSMFAVAAAKMALEDSGLTAAEAQAANAGVHIGSALGGTAFGEEQHKIVHRARSAGGQPPARLVRLRRRRVVERGHEPGLDRSRTGLRQLLRGGGAGDR